MSYLISAAQFVGGIIKGTEASVKQIDKWTGAAGAREKQEQFLNEQKDLQKKKEEDEQRLIEDGKTMKRVNDDQASLAAASRARSSQEKSTAGRRGTILTGNFGLKPDSYTGAGRRTILGAG